MKPTRKEIPPEIRAEADFGYVNELPQHLHQLVCFYEYWRESEEHRSLINFCRTFKVFTPEWKQQGINGSEFKKIADMSDIFPISMVLRITTRCAGFPAKPFNNCGYEDQTGYTSAPRRGVSESAWRLILALREIFENGGSSGLNGGFLEFLEAPSLDKHLWPISIDWGYTNDELASSFRQLIERIRPKQFPEPKKAGREGRSTGAGITDKLNHLGAFRLDRAGFSFDEASRLTIYSSERGWLNAIRMAKTRIANLATHTLFGDKEVAPGIKLSAF